MDERRSLQVYEQRLNEVLDYIERNYDQPLMLAHISDVARLFRLVLESGEAGAKYHAVGEEGVELRAIAEAIGRRLGVPVMFLTPEEAPAHFGPYSMFVGQDLMASSAITRETLNWRPTGQTLIADLERIA